jgi:hypothetical protein
MGQLPRDTIESHIKRLPIAKLHMPLTTGVALSGGSGIELHMKEFHPYHKTGGGVFLDHILSSASHFLSQTVGRSSSITWVDHRRAWELHGTCLSSSPSSSDESDYIDFQKD